MASESDGFLEELAGLREEIATNERELVTLRQQQFGQLAEALGAGATIAEAVRSTGVSRAYLAKRDDVPLFTPQTTHARKLRKSGDVDPYEARSAALREVARIRDEIEQLAERTNQLRDERGDLIVTAVQSGSVKRVEIETAAGVSSESVRKRLRKND